MEPWHGIDVEDLDDSHSLGADPTVARLRETARLLGQDIWITVKLPGEYEGDDDLDDGTAIRRWTTVVLHPRRARVAVRGPGPQGRRRGSRRRRRVTPPAAGRHVRDNGPVSLPPFLGTRSHGRMGVTRNCGLRQPADAVRDRRPGQRDPCPQRRGP